MMVKRYVVQDMPEAIIMIRQELGKNAVILSTRKVTVKKWMGLVRKKRIEVLAAAGEDVPIRTTLPQSTSASGEPSTEDGSQYRSSQSAASRHRSQELSPVQRTPREDRLPASREEGLTEQHTAQEERMPREERTSQARLFQQRLSQERSATPQPFREAEAVATVTRGTGAAATYQTQQQIATAVTTHPLPEGTSEDTRKTAADIEALQQELAQVKAALQSLLDHTASMRTAAVGEGESLWRKQGVESKQLIAELTDFLSGVRRHQIAIGSELWRQRLDPLARILPQCDDGKPLSENARVVAFVGQTGVGKTTTVAKIAALEMLSGRRKVGLITADTYRIAAVDQLRTYARILDVPLEVVQDIGDVESAVAKLADRELILIDTAGRNYGVQENFEEITRFMQLPVIDETHLVMSLAGKPEDLNRTAERFTAYPVDKFLFTKLDETSGHAVALELLYRFGKPVSYLTNGQNVPDDIEIATLDKLVALILEGAA